MKIIWSPLAITRVVEIGEWIATERPQVARALVDELFAAVERLSHFPQSGREVPEIRQPDMRELIFKRYRIIYKTHPNRIEILTVRHSRQELDAQDLVQ